MLLSMENSSMRLGQMDISPTNLVRPVVALLKSKQHAGTNTCLRFSDRKAPKWLRGLLVTLIKTLGFLVGTFKNHLS